MDKLRLQALYLKYRMHILTAEEWDDFRAILADPEWEVSLNEILDKDWHAISEGELTDIDRVRADEIYREIIKSEKK